MNDVWACDPLCSMRGGSLSHIHSLPHLVESYSWCANSFSPCFDAAHMIQILIRNCKNVMFPSASANTLATRRANRAFRSLSHVASSLAVSTPELDVLA